MLFRDILVWSTTVHQLPPQMGPKRTPNSFGTIRIHNSYPSVWSGIPVPSTVVPSHLPGIFMFLLFLPRLMQWYLIVAAHHSVRCFLASRVVAVIRRIFPSLSPGGEGGGGRCGLHP